MSQLEIKTATFDHLHELAQLFDAYRMFYGQPSDLEAARAFLFERQSQGQSIAFIAQIAEKTIGFTQLYPVFSSVFLKRLWLLNDLFVVPEARGLRVGERLIERAIRLARETGAKGIQLETAHSNQSGQKLYERMGFKREDLEFRTYFLEV